MVQNHSLKQQSIVREGFRRDILDSLINQDDQTCVYQLHMDIRSFRLLCVLLRNDGRLKEDGLVSVEEQVAMFLHILAHHSKNHVIRFMFKRSGETVSRYFNLVLNVVL